MVDFADDIPVGAVFYKGEDLEFVGEGGGLRAAVGLLDVSLYEDTGHEHFSNHVPFQESRGALHRKLNAIHHGRIMLLAAADEFHLLALNRFLSYTEREQSINDSLDLSRNRIPIYGHCKHDCIRIKDMGSDDVEVIVERAGLAGLEAGHAGMAAPDLHHSGIKANYFMTLGFRCLDEGIHHGESIAVLTGTSCNYSYLHFLMVFEF